MNERANPVIDDFAAIRSRIAEVREAERPRCPTSPSRYLYDCLRSSSRCPDGCEFRADWIGPQP